MKINYNGKEVGKWYHNDAVIPKAYINDNMVFPRMPDSAPPTPEYDVMCSGSISDYTGNAPEVFCFSVNKWYMRTIGGNYTEYGIYATGKPQDPYIGELAMDSGHEWEYTSNGWVDLGETSRLPQGYTELEYIEAKQASNYANNSYLVVDFKVNQDTRILCSMQRVTSSYYARLFGSGAYNAVNAMQIDYEQGATGSLHVSWGAVAGWTTYNVNGDYNKHEYDINKNVISIDGVEIGSTTYANFQCTDNLGIFTEKQPNMDTTNFEYYWGKMFYFKVFDNGTLALDLVPAKRDNDSVAGAYDVVNKVFYTSETAVNFTAGPVAESSGGGIVKEYEFKGEPDIPDMDYKVMLTGTISDYTGSESKVYCFSTDKWYMRTVEGNYKEYGVYADQLSTDAYIGELAVYNGHEYEYTASGWSDLGEVQGGGSLPINVFSLNYNAKHMDGNTFLREEGQLVDADATINGSNYTINDGYVTIGNTNAGTTYCAVGGFQTYMNRNNSNPEITIISKAKTNPAYNNHYSLLCNRGSSYNWMWRPYRNKLCLHGGSGEQGNLSIPQGEVVIGSARVNSSRQLILNDWSNGTTNTTNSFSYGSLENGGFAMFRDYYNSTSEPWSGDFYWVFMCQSTLTDEEIQQVIQYNEEGGIEYIKEYTALADPEPIGTTYTTAADEYLKVNDNYYKKDYITYEYQCGAYLPSTDYVQGDQLTPIYVQGEASDFIVYESGRYYKNYIYVQPVDQQLATGDYVRGVYIGPADVIISGVTKSSSNFTVKIDNTDTTAYVTTASGSNYNWVVYGDLNKSISNTDNFAYNNTNLISCHIITSGITSFGYRSFRGCSNLVELSYPNSVTSIGDYAFYGCSGLLSVTIPNSVTSIGQQAFYNLSGLKTLTIGSGVNSIHQYAFGYLSSLETTTVDQNNTTYDSRNNCNAIIHTSTNSLVVGQASATTIPNTITSIRTNAFRGNSGLKEITIPSSVTTIEWLGMCDVDVAVIHIEATVPFTIASNAFNYGYGIIYVPVGTASTYKGASNWSNYANRIYEEGYNFGTAAVTGTSTGGTVMIRANRNSNEMYTNITSVNQDGTQNFAYLGSTTIMSIGSGTGTYKNSNNIISIDFSNCSGVTSVNGYAFYNSNLITVTLPDSITSIGELAFYGSKLSSINIPSGVTLIDHWAFYGLDTIIHMNPNTPPTLGNRVFDNGYGIIYVPDASVDTYKAASGWMQYASRIKPISEMPVS